MYYSYVIVYLFPYCYFYSLVVIYCCYHLINICVLSCFMLLNVSLPKWVTPDEWDINSLDKQERLKAVVL